MAARVPGRSGAAVQAWLGGAQPEAWRAGIEVVAVDPSGPFAAAVRRLLPQATLVVDHWHLVRLANQAVTEVRQRIARQQYGRRGRKADPAWAHRRLLLAAGDRLSTRGLARLTHLLAVDDPTNEIGAAWGIKELLRQLPAAPTPHDARHRLFRFYDAVLAADMPETTRLAEAISTWWPAIEAFLYQALIEAELTVVIGAGPHEADRVVAGAPQWHRLRTLTTTAGIWSCGSRSCGPGRSVHPCWNGAGGWTRPCSRW